MHITEWCIIKAQKKERDRERARKAPKEKSKCGKDNYGEGRTYTTC